MEIVFGAIKLNQKQKNYLKIPSDVVWNSRQGQKTHSFSKKH